MLMWAAATCPTAGAAQEHIGTAHSCGHRLQKQVPPSACPHTVSIPWPGCIIPNNAKYPHFMPSTTAIPDLLDHLQAFSSSKLADARRHSTPFPWLEIDKFVPSGLMDGIHQNFPGAEVMDSMPEARTGNIYAHRYRRLFTLNEKTFPLLPPESIKFWRLFDSFIQRMIPALLQALPEAPKGQRVQHEPVSELKARLDLWVDRGGYQIPPHTDAPHKLATFLLYCSQDPSLSGEGTSIFVPLDATKSCWEGRQWPFDQFQQVYTTPYGPNRLFGFRKTDRSFHGKLPVAESSAERRTIAITLQTARGLVA